MMNTRSGGNRIGPSRGGLHPAAGVSPLPPRPLTSTARYTPRRHAISIIEIDLFRLKKSNEDGSNHIKIQQKNRDGKKERKQR